MALRALVQLVLTLALSSPNPNPNPSRRLSRRLTLTPTLTLTLTLTLTRRHEAVFLAAQTPIESKTVRWRLKGGGGDGVLPHSTITQAFEFIMGEDYVQKVSFGTRRLRLDGTDGQRWAEVPANERTICAEQIWLQYVKVKSSGAAAAAEGVGAAEDGEDAPVLVESASCGQRLSRAHFLKLVNLVTSSTQKAYGALDSYSELNGRQQVERLRGNIDEIKEMAQLLLQPGLLPVEAQERAAATAAGTALGAAAGKLRTLLDDVEKHIKRGYSQHMPGCTDPEPPAEAATCAEHCRACSFGWPSGGGDGSRPAGCTRQHTLRCPECAAVHSLQPNFDAVLELLAKMVNCAEGAADAAAAPTATESGAATGGGGAGAGGGDGVARGGRRSGVSGDGHRLLSVYQEAQGEDLQCKKRRRG